MKKLILSLLIFCSVLLQAQIQIPQVVGLPAALSGKEAKLPSAPSNPESRFLNGNKQWAEIVIGSGGYASNVYFTNLTSTIVGNYKQTSGVNDVAETIASGTCNNNEVLIRTYLFEQPVGITTIDAGVWRITLNSVIDAAAGDSKFKFVQYKRSAAGVETDMFTVYSNTIENRVGYEGYLNNVFETVQPSFTVDATDRLGCRVYATTTAAGSRTLSYKVGDGYASYLNTPLALRHDQNRDKNGNPLYQHATTDQIATWTATSLNNTGDETLTSIKTKLGAATSVSDGYLKYQDWNTFNSKEPAITKNTAFNKNFGTTTGTVLEGRTFGTAAGSAVGDFIQNQNVSAQSASMWIGGSIKSGTITSTHLVLKGGIPYVDFMGVSDGLRISSGLYVPETGGNSGSDYKIYFYDDNGSYLGNPLIIKRSTREATFESTVNSTGFLLNGNNLTSSLTTNFIPKWNGSNFVNSLISDDGTSNINLGNNTIRIGDRSSELYYSKINYNLNTSGNADLGYLSIKIHNWPDEEFDAIHITGKGNTKILATTPSTSPTNGALVVNGGIGADHVRANNFYGNGSNLTGVQLPITLTTNGTSGAATFSGNVLNVPNYASTGTGGSYTASISSGSNTANPVVYSSLYTKNGTVYSSIIKGYIECTGSQGNTCTFNVSTYNGSTANLSIIGVGAQGTNIILGSGSTGSNVVMSFTNPVGSGGIGFTLIIHYTN